MDNQKITSDKPAFTAKIIEMWQKEHGCDVSILCEDQKSTKAHSIVLRSVSEKIDQLLDSTSQSVIVSEDVSVDVWKSLLEIVYTGAIKTPQKNLDLEAVKNLATAFQIEAVVEQLEKADKLNDGHGISVLNDHTDSHRDIEQNSNDSNTKKERSNETQINSPRKTPKKTRQKTKVTSNETNIPEIEVLDDIVVRRSGRKTKRHFCTQCKECFATNTLFSEHACFGISRHAKHKKRAKVKTRQVRPVRDDREEEDSVQMNSQKDLSDAINAEDSVQTEKESDNVTENDEHIPNAEMSEQDKSEKESVGESETEVVNPATELVGTFIAEKRKDLILEKVECPSTKDIDKQKSKPDDTLSVKKDPVDEIKKEGDMLSERPPNLYCIYCDQECHAEKVICLYCYKVVTHIQRHMSKKHRYVPPSSIKIYSCQTDRMKSSKDFMVFMKEPKINHHTKDKVEDFQYRCSKCALLFNSLPNVVKHLKLKHPHPKVCVCKSCGCGFLKTEMFTDHKHFCSGGELYRCNWCEEKFWRKADCKTHILSRHPDQDINHLENLQDSEDDQTFDCSQMQEEQSLGSALRSFEPVTVKRDEPFTQMCIRCGPNCTASNVKCHYCCQVIDRQDKLTHMEEVHPLIPSYSLWPVDCNKYHKTNSSAPEILSRQVFLKKDHPKSIQVAYHVCVLCNKEFLSPGLLKKHFSKTHKISATCCDQCGLLIRSSWRSLSKDHINLCAGGDFVKCRQCGKLCGSFESAKLHQMKSHTQQYHAVRQARTRKKAAKYVETETKFSPISLSKGDNGCNILCVGCIKRCESDKPVTCRLCLAVVAKNDGHMKSEHPHSPTDTWVISCETLTDSMNTDHLFLIGRMISKDSDEVMTQYQCVECGISFLESGDLLEHVKVHVDPSIQSLSVDTCHHCQCVFIKSPANEGAFEDHVQFCGTGQLHTCDFCEQRFSSFKELRCHSENVHKAVQVATSVTDVDNKDQHAENVKGSKKRLHQELAEIVAEHVGESGQAICVTCGTKCTNTTVLCLYCFEIVQNIQEHRSHQHPFIPDNRLSVYSCNINLIETSGRHVRIMTKEEKHNVTETAGLESLPEIFDCITCHQTFSSLEKLQAHITFQFKCSRCGLYFNSVVDILNHIEDKHHCSSVHMCHCCYTGFVDEELCKVHRYYCQGGRVMRCRWCKWLFWKDEDFQEHVTLVHLEQQNLSFDGELDVKDEEEKPKRRRLTTGSFALTPTANAPSVTDPCTFQRAVYEEVPINRTEEYMKVCFTCQDRCVQSEVQCAYCNDVVLSSQKIQHMQETHPLIPPTSLWPVRCKNKSMKGTGPDILSKQVFMSTVLESSPEFEEGTVQLTLTGYECAICDAEIPTAMQLKVHLKEVHSIDAVECHQCGMVIRSSCRVMVKDHLNLCSGGEFVRCKICGKLCGSVGSVHIHHIKVHASFSSTNAVEPNLPRKSVGEVLEGKQGYKIICVNCNDTCNTNKRPVKCRLCNLVVPKDDIHMKLKHPFSLCTTWYVTCLYNMFPEKGFYIGQKLVVEGEEPLVEYQCSDCMVKFAKHADLLVHIEDSHLAKTLRGTVKLKVCHVCEGIFKIMNESYCSFKDHVHFCGGGSLYKCDYCSEVFGFSVKLKRHINKHHSGEKMILHSTSKGMSIGGRQYVKVERGVQPVEIPPGTELQCAECPFISYDYTELRKHNKQKHDYNLLQLNQLCRFCFKVFRKMSEREKHEQKQHLGGQRFFCEQCGADFEIRSQLHHHVEYHHKGQRELIVERQKMLRAKQPVKVCAECGETFKLTFYYNQHIKMVHEKSLEFKCHLCGKQLSSKYKLKIHIDRHKGYKPFKCHYCSYRDYTGALVNLHIRKEHSSSQLRKLSSLKEGSLMKENFDHSQEVSERAEVQAEYLVQEEVNPQEVKVVQNYIETAEGEVEGTATQGVPVQYVYAVQYM